MGEREINVMGERGISLMVKKISNRIENVKTWI